MIEINYWEELMKMEKESHRAIDLYLSCYSKLNNENFLLKANENIVTKEKQKLHDSQTIMELLSEQSYRLLKFILNKNE